MPTCSHCRRRDTNNRDEVRWQFCRAEFARLPVRAAVVVIGKSAPGMRAPHPTPKFIGNLASIPPKIVLAVVNSAMGAHAWSSDR